jgi:hypothetical protein
VKPPNDQDGIGLKCWRKWGRPHHCNCPRDSRLHRTFHLESKLERRAVEAQNKLSSTLRRRLRQRRLMAIKASLGARSIVGTSAFVAANTIDTHVPIRNQEVGI